MDDISFDRLTLRLRPLVSRRAALGGLGLAALGGPGLVESKNAKRRKRRKRKKREKVTFNAFGCVNVGAFCQTSEQCCSGICEGPKDKRRCQPHDQTTCQGGEDYCNFGPPLECESSAGNPGLCVRTTGNASYCEAKANCHACSKDADCVPFCGAEAACIVCQESCPLTGTACASIDVFSCVFP